MEVSSGRMESEGMEVAEGRTGAAFIEEEAASRWRKKGSFQRRIGGRVVGVDWRLEKAAPSSDVHCNPEEGNSYLRES